MTRALEPIDLSLHRRKLDGRCEVWQKLSVEQPFVRVPAMHTLTVRDGVWHEGEVADPYIFLPDPTFEWVLVFVGWSEEAGAVFAGLRSNARAPLSAGNGFGSSLSKES